MYVHKYIHTQYIPTYIYIYIQGVWRLVDITAGDDFLGLCVKKVHINMRCVRFTLLWAFFNSRTRCRVNLVLRNQLAGDLFNLLVYRLRCKHNFCHLTRPPSNRESSFRISTLGLYLGNEGKVGWVFAWPVYTAWLSYYYVYKNPITLQWLQTPDFQNSAAIVS